MKRLMGMFLLLTLALVGCGEADAPPVESSPTTLPAAITAPPAQAADTVAELEKPRAVYRDGNCYHLQ